MDSSKIGNGRDLQPLVYSGEIIHQSGDMLSLTDMWRASGSPENREPFNWARFEGSAFIQAVALTHNLSEAQVMTARRGKGGGTLAHWQVGLAYAKYLDHDFHMWTNTVVRERMESAHLRAAMPAIATPRDAAGAFRAYFSVGRLIGLDRNQSILSANQATRKRLGIDLLADMGQAALLAPQQHKTLTPSDIGVEMGGKSGMAINSLLAEHGFQVGKRDAKDRTYWEPTEVGQPFAVWQDTSKRHGDGTPVRQLKWTASILGVLQERLTLSA